MRPPRLRMVPFCLCAVLLVASAAPAPAQTNVWLGGGATGVWNDAGNWVAGVPTSGPTNDLLFAGSNNLNTTQNIANPFDLNKLTFDTSAGAFAINSNSERFVANGATAPTLAINTNSPITFANSPVTFNATGSIGGTGTGTLSLNGLTAGSGTLTVNRNGVSAGTLTVSNGATIAPASPTTSIGTLAVGSGGASITGTYAADIGAGTSSDLLNISGPLTLAAGSTLAISGTPTAGSTYTLANYTSRTGTFGTVSGLPANYQVQYGATSVQLVPVPEPALILALCAAGAGVVGWRRRHESRFGVAV
ncbi:MAG TPA: PEP-CTERM sorting domain-containing protein [Gemmataceae bacterium]|nr:PEP-CTERM sorting domain-containing protein [Gemmataceae bacterium]